MAEATIQKQRQDVKIAIDQDEPIDTLLEREWLLTSGTGSYSSSTILGVNTRRYHGLLIASTRPPLGRVSMLAGLGETLTVDGEFFELFNWEFDGIIHPSGYEYLRSVAVGQAVTMSYEIDEVRLEKTISFIPGTDVLTVRYRIRNADGAWKLSLRPFVSLRDFHSLRQYFVEDQITVTSNGGQILLKDRLTDAPGLCLGLGGGKFVGSPGWWYKFRYRKEAERGQDYLEDLFVPGAFVVSGQGSGEVVLTAGLEGQSHPDLSETGRISEEVEKRTEVPIEMAEADQRVGRLVRAAESFLAGRRAADGREAATILAGFHWFGDWGRDAFIALPGLLLTTGRFAEARKVFETFIGAISEGMIPNCFDDYDREPAYNSVDASLWFVHAAELYMAATDDSSAWRGLLRPAVCQILDCYEIGTRFGIHADENGLIVCGDEQTQLTWMDSQHDGQCFTPRPGAAVEVNALWYSVLVRTADRLAAEDPQRAKRYSALAKKVKRAFRTIFWNDKDGYLYDYIWQGRGNKDIRPNQILAVSLPCSPLSHMRQKSVVQVVREKLLTPFGLRSLNQGNPQYRCCCAGDRASRDSAYHQGTVWSWLIGPFVEAHLKVHNFSKRSRQEAQEMIEPLLEHMEQAGVGFVSEIFDGDSPHRPRGCIAQAWSVGELLRACSLIHSI